MIGVWIGIAMGFGSVVMLYLEMIRQEIEKSDNRGRGLDMIEVSKCWLRQVWQETCS